MFDNNSHLEGDDVDNDYDSDHDDCYNCDCYSLVHVFSDDIDRNAIEKRSKHRRCRRSVHHFELHSITMRMKLY